MEGVEDGRLEEALQREGQVHQVEDKSSVLHQKRKRDPSEFEVKGGVHKIHLFRLVVNEGLVIGSLG